MAEETTTAAVVEETKTEPDRNDKGKDDSPLRAEGEKALSEFKKRARDAEKRAKELETRVKEFEEKDKSEFERAVAQRDAAAKERDEAQARSLRLEVAYDKQLPRSLANRLSGESKEELEADADELLKLVKPADTTDFDGGARTPAPEKKSPDDAHNEFVLDLLAGKRPS